MPSRRPMNVMGGDRVLGELYEAALAGTAQAEVEHSDGTRVPLAVDQWLEPALGDTSLVDRCSGPTLDVGSGPGRLTVALAERGIPALGIDVTPYAVQIAQSSGAFAILRDVFGRVPGTGRWRTGTSGSGVTRPRCSGGSATCWPPTATPWSRCRPRVFPCALTRCGCAGKGRPATGSPGPTWGPTLSATWPGAPA